MMKSTPEQIAFIRAHGITKCPPSPQARAIWGGGPDHKRGGWSEEDQLAQMRTAGMVITLNGTNLSERRFGHNRPPREAAPTRSHKEG